MHLFSLAIANQRASDYKDDGTNILLDANENAYGPVLSLTNDGKFPGASTNGASAIDVDLLGLNRYPDPYDSNIILAFQQSIDMPQVTS